VSDKETALSETQNPGRRRIDRIMREDFGANPQDLSLEEVRSRRDDCLAEREYLSYLRRLFHGRLEILRAEQKARAEGVEVPLVDRLASILGSDTPIGPSRGEALRLGLPEEEMNNARRRVEKILDSVAFSDPSVLDDDKLVAAIEALEAEEHEVSATRRRVLDLHDLFQEEIKRRYRDQLAAAEQ
jgi:hypothetical protein